MRLNILRDYGIEEHTHPHVDLFTHLAYFVHELTEHCDLEDEGSWNETRYKNLVCGPHEDAHMFVDTCFTGDWDNFWTNLEDSYIKDLPDDNGKYGPKGIEELVYELAFLGNRIMRTLPELYDEWPEGFYTSHFKLDLGEHDQLPDDE